MEALAQRGSPSAKVRRRSLALGRRVLGHRRGPTVHSVLGELAAAVEPLQGGLDRRAALRAARAIRRLLDVAAVGIGQPDEPLLALVGPEGRAHGSLPQLSTLSAATLRSGKVQTATVDCAEPACGLGDVIAAPIVTRDGVAATLLALTASERSATAELTRSVGEVARQLGLQLELGMIERRRRQLRDARLAALQSQMSPHFVYNTITAIASLVRTDPEQARELLFRFAELCRYVLRQGPLRTTLAEELRIVHVYVELERARKRADLEIVFRIDPATLAAPLPMMTLQPLVENAVQHGLAAGATGGRGVVTVEAHDRGHEMVLTVSDNGCGIEPDALDRLRRSIDPQRPEPTGSQASVALVNVADRLEAAHGSGARLEIESSAGAGTAVRLRLPKDGTGGDR